MNNVSKLTIAEDGSIPIYQRIKNAIGENIQSGLWQAGELIPSENQLCDMLSASRMTVNRALRELAAEGLLKRVHGVGTFVATRPRRAQLIELRSIADEIKLAGKEHSAKVLKLREAKAQRHIAKRLELPTGSSVFQIQVVHYQDKVPIQIELRSVNPNVVPEFLSVDFDKTTPAEYLIDTVVPTQMEHVVQAILPDSFLTKHLDIKADEPCLKLRRRTWLEQQIVTSVDLIYPSSRYDLGAVYNP